MSIKTASLTGDEIFCVFKAEQKQKPVSLFILAPDWKGKLYTIGWFLLVNTVLRSVCGGTADRRVSLLSAEGLVWLERQYLTISPGNVSNMTKQENPAVLGQVFVIP